MYGGDKIRSWVLCPHNKSFSPLLCVRCGDGTWIEFPTLNSLLKYKNGSNSVHVVRAVPLVGISVHVIAVDSFTRDCFSPRQTCSPAFNAQSAAGSPVRFMSSRSQRLFGVEPQRLKKMYTYSSAPHGLITPQHHNNAASTRCGFVVIEDIVQDALPLNAVGSERMRTWKNWDAALVQYGTLCRDRRVLDVQNHIEFVFALLGVGFGDPFILKRGSVWFQVNRSYQRREVVDVCSDDRVVTSCQGGNVVCVTRTFEVTCTPNADTEVCTRNTGYDVFSKAADTTLVDRAVTAFYKITHESDSNLVEDNVDLLNSLFQDDASDFLHICSQMKNPYPHVLLKKVGSHCCLRSMEVLDIAAWMWWPVIGVMVFTQDIDMSHCARINDSVGYELLEFDDMAMRAVVRIDITRHPYAQFVVVDDHVQLWCVPTGELVQLGIMTSAEYELLETEIKPMSRKHVHFVPGGLVRRTIMLRPLVTNTIPFTACVVDTGGTTRWLLHHKKSIFSKMFHKAADSGSSFGSSTFARVRQPLLTDEYKVPKAKIMKLMNDPTFSTAVSLLTLSDVRTLLYMLHSNAVYLDELCFPNPMNMRIDDQSKYWMWSGSHIRSPNNRLCVLCAHLLGITDHNTDPIRKHIIDALLTKKNVFTYRGCTHTIKTCSGCVCVTTTRNGQTVEVWRDAVPQSTKCQFCALKRENCRVFLTPKFFDHNTPQGSIAETIQTTILALCLNSKHVEVSRTCMVASTALLQVLITFLTSDAPWITDDFLEHLVKNVLFPPDIMRAVYTARVGHVRKHDVGSGFHLEQRQIMRLPSMLLLTQACVAATLYMYVGASAHKSMDGNFCVSHNMARDAMQRMFSTVMVGTNLLVALHKTSDFLAQYMLNVTPTHRFLLVVENTERVVAEMLRGVDDDVLRASITNHMLYLNFVNSCVAFNSLSPMVTFCDNKLRVCGMTYAQMHERIITPLVTHVANRHTREDTLSHSFNGADDMPTLSTIPCRLLLNSTRRDVYFCQTHDSHASPNGWVDCDASVDADDLLENKWCCVCDKPLYECAHHCVCLDTVSCLKCGKYVSKVGSMVGTFTREERLLYPQRAVSLQDSDTHASLEHMSRHVVEKISAKLSVTSKQVGIPEPLIMQSATPQSHAPLELLALDSMEAACACCTGVTYIRKNYMKMLFYKKISTGICVGNNLFSLLCWVRWCAAFASGGCIPHKLMQHAATGLSVDNEHQQALVAHMLSIVYEHPGTGWLDLFLYAFGDHEKTLLATDVMLVTQRTCVLNAKASKRYAAMLYANVMQVSYWLMGLAEECVFESMCCNDVLVSHAIGTKRNVCVFYSTYHLRILAELCDFATHNNMLNMVGVIGTADMEFVRFATWVICCMLRKRYHLDGYSRATLLSQAFKHFQFDHTPCVRCAAGRVCLKTGICSGCSCVANEFVVPFGATQQSPVHLNQSHDQSREMIANVDVLPSAVVCGDHREFVDIVLQTLLEVRWKNDERLLRDLLTCHAAKVCDTKQVQIDKCVAIQYACVFWNTNCDNELRQQLRTNELSLYHVARNCQHFLMPRHQPSVSMVQPHATSSTRYNENICSLAALREMVSMLLFYDKDVAFRLDGMPDAVLASLTKDTELHERLLAAANRVSAGVHAIVRARLKQSTKVVDTSVLHLIDSCAHMYTSEERRSVCTMYIEFVHDVISTYQQNTTRHGGTTYAFFAGEPLELTTGTILDFLISVVQIGHFIISSDHTPSVHIKWMQQIHHVSTASLRGDRNITTVHYTREDEFFIRIALKGAYLMQQTEAHVRTGKFLFAGIPDHLLKHAFEKLNMKVTVAVSSLYRTKKLKTR